MKRLKRVLECEWLNGLLTTLTLTAGFYALLYATILQCK